METEREFSGRLDIDIDMRAEMRGGSKFNLSEDDNCYRNLWRACALVYCCASQKVSDQQRSRQTVGTSL